jgi:hypothetical protein
MKFALYLSLIAAVAAKTVIWNGRSASLGISKNWQGEHPATQLLPRRRLLEYFFIASHQDNLALLTLSI